MQQTIDQLKQNFALSGSLRDDMTIFLTQRGHAKTAGHCIDVGVEAKRLAEQFGIDIHAAEVAGLLYDISAVIPNSQRLAAAQEWGVDIQLKDKLER